VHVRRTQAACSHRPWTGSGLRPTATLVLTDDAKLDEGAMWPTSYALKKLTAAEEARITRS
jgi:hypothetical protein